MTTRPLPESGPVENRIHERVYLRDVVAVLPGDTLVDVVGRAEIVPDGPRRFEHVEHLVVLDAEAYEILRALPTMPRSKRGEVVVAQPLPAPTLTVHEVERRIETWVDRAKTFERAAKAEATAGLDAGQAKRLAEVCRAAVAELAWVAERLADAHAAATPTGPVALAA